MNSLPVNTIALASGDLGYISNTNGMAGYDKDIIPGVYEGGFKLWECTVDLLRFMESQKLLLAGKRVMEIGCGHGLAGILARKLGAQLVCLQDYNQEVIEKLTIPTVRMNCGTEQGFTFLSGDWSTLKSELKYDIIIGSQLIYSEENYSKIISVIGQFLAEGGVAILANKHYYFGVGGNMPGFKKSLAQTGHFSCESLAKLVPQKGGNKKQIVKITKI